MKTTLRQITNTNAALRHGWHPVALGTEIDDEPVPVRLLGQSWVVARLDDRLAAFADRCPSRLAPTSTRPGDHDEPACPYHNWRFVASGECTAISALGAGARNRPRVRATPPFGITERHGIVWIAPEEPLADIIDLPEDSDPAFDSAWLPVARTSAHASLLAGTLLGTTQDQATPDATTGCGNGERTLVQHYRVEADDDGFRAAVEHDVANPHDPGVAAGIRPLVQRRSSKYVFRPPFMLRRRLEYPDAGTTSTLLFCLQPEDDGATRIYTRILRDDLRGDTRRLVEAVRFEQAALDEDLALLTRQEKYPVDGLPPGTVPAGRSGDSAPAAGRSGDSAPGDLEPAGRAPGDPDPTGCQPGDIEPARHEPARHEAGDRALAEGRLPEVRDSRADAARAALYWVLVAFTERAERGCAQTSRRAGAARPRYARRPSVTAGHQRNPSH